MLALALVLLKRFVDENKPAAPRRAEEPGRSEEPKRAEESRANFGSIREGNAFVLPIQEVFFITGTGTVAVGVVQSGIVRPGPAVLMPQGKRVQIGWIESHHEKIPQATPGTPIGVALPGISKQDVPRGSLLVSE